MLVAGNRIRIRLSILLPDGRLPVRIELSTGMLNAGILAEIAGIQSVCRTFCERKADLPPILSLDAADSEKSPVFAFDTLKLAADTVGSRRAVKWMSRADYKGIDDVWANSCRRLGFRRRSSN